MICRRFPFLALGLSMLMFGCATPRTVDSDSPLTAAEQKFMNTAAQDSAAEVAAGKAAVNKASNPQVRQYAQRMVDEHTTMNEMMMQLARKKNITIPSRPDEQHTQAVAMMSNLSGADFDKAYMSQMIVDHTKTTTMFDEQLKTAKDPELRTFIQQHAGHMMDHLQQAKQINNSLTGARSDRSGDSTGTDQMTTPSSDTNRGGTGRSGNERNRTTDLRDNNAR